MSFVDNHHGGPGIKLSNFIEPTCSDDFLCFLKQIGVDYCFTWITPEQAEDYDFLSHLRDRVNKNGLCLFNIGCMDFGKSPNIILGLQDKNKDLDKFCRFIRMLKKIGVSLTTVTWEPDNMVSTTLDGKVARVLSLNEEDVFHAKTRGGATTRYVDTEVLENAPPVRGTIVSKEEIWDNFSYFLKVMIPVAEEADVRICLHPNDPPTQKNLGVATLINSAEDYRRAFKLANSEYLGMEFCCGCWLEGGCDSFGNIEENIQEFVSEGKVSIAHFRNVSSKLPRFVETFLDNGYGDMFRIMKAFVAAGYNGSMTHDHSPSLIAAAGPMAQAAFNNGYMKGLLDAANKVVI